MLKLEQTIASVEVADMVDMRHADVIRKIEIMIGYMTERNIALSEFFTLSSYKDVTGRSNKQYLLTKKGCELFANKLTDEKGTLFSIAYVDRFNQMENTLKEVKQDSYMIDDPIKRAERWIEEKKAYLALEAKSEQLTLELKEKEEELFSLKGLFVGVEHVKMEDFHKMLCNNGLYTKGRNTLYSELLNKGIWNRDKMPYQPYLKYFDRVPVPYKKGNVTFTNMTTFVKVETIEKFVSVLINKGICKINVNQGA